MLIAINKHKKAQSTAEYVIVLALVVGAVVAMQTFVKRGLQGRLKDATNYTGDAQSSAIFKGNQYEPYYTSSNIETYSNSESTENVEASGGNVERTSNEYQTKTGNYSVSNAE